MCRCTCIYFECLKDCTGCLRQFCIVNFEYVTEISVLCHPAVQFYGHIGGKQARVRLLPLFFRPLCYDKSL